MNAHLVQFAVLAEMYETELWLALIAGVVLTLVGGARVAWHHGEDRMWAALAAAEYCCWACEVMAAADTDDDGPLTDEVMDPIGDIFDGEIRPVNPPRPPSVWSRLDSPPSNRGRRFDGRSRASNERLGRWMSDEQKKMSAEQQGRIVQLAGPMVVAEAEAEIRRAARDRGETTGEIRRGDPGE